MTPRYTFEKRGRVWVVTDQAYRCDAGIWPTRASAKSWVLEHQEDIGPNFLFRYGIFDVFAGGGMANSLRAELRVIQGGAA